MSQPQRLPLGVDWFLCKGLRTEDVTFMCSLDCQQLAIGQLVVAFASKLCRVMGWFANRKPLVLRNVILNMIVNLFSSVHLVCVTFVWCRGCLLAPMECKLKQQNNDQFTQRLKELLLATVFWMFNREPCTGCTLAYLPRLLLIGRATMSQLSWRFSLYSNLFYPTAFPNDYVRRILSWKASPPQMCDFSVTHVSDVCQLHVSIRHSCNINLHQFALWQGGNQSTRTLSQPPMSPSSETVTQRNKRPAYSSLLLAGRPRI